MNTIRKLCRWGQKSKASSSKGKAGGETAPHPEGRSGRKKKAGEKRKGQSPKLLADGIMKAKTEGTTFKITHVVGCDDKGNKRYKMNREEKSDEKRVEMLRDGDHHVQVERGWCYRERKEKLRRAVNEKKG